MTTAITTTFPLNSVLVFNEIRKSIESLDDNKKKKLLNQVNGVFQFHIKSDLDNQVGVFTVDLKHDGSVSNDSKHEADTIISMSDSDFINVASGRITSQKAYNLGKLKIKGQMKLATKLDTVLKQLKGKSKL
ncbi:unnamed protein product [Mucor hiemalis]